MIDAEKLKKTLQDMSRRSEKVHFDLTTSNKPFLFLSKVYSETCQNKNCYDGLSHSM